MDSVIGKFLDYLEFFLVVRNVLIKITHFKRIMHHKCLFLKGIVCQF